MENLGQPPELGKSEPPSVLEYRGGKRLASALSTATGGLTKEDTAAVIVGLLKGRGQLGASEDEMAKALEWAHKIFFDWVLLRLVIEGQTQINFNGEGEVIFFATKREMRPS